MIHHCAKLQTKILTNSITSMLINIIAWYFLGSIQLIVCKSVSSISDLLRVLLCVVAPTTPNLMMIQNSSLIFSLIANKRSLAWYQVVVIERVGRIAIQRDAFLADYLFETENNVFNMVAGKAVGGLLSAIRESDCVLIE